MKINAARLIGQVVAPLRSNRERSEAIRARHRNKNEAIHARHLERSEAIFNLAVEIITEVHNYNR